MSHATTLDQDILTYLISLCKFYKKGYCFPSQTKILSILKKDFNYTCSRRTLNYHLKRLVEQGFIKRIRRHTKGKDGNLVFRSTCYIILRKAYNFINYVYCKCKRALGRFKKYIKKSPSDLLVDNLDHISRLPDQVLRQRFKELYDAID